MPRQAPKLYSVYGRGGWSLAKKQALDAVNLPEKSRCFECDKFKTTLVAFSEKQLNNLRNGLASGQVPANTAKAWITCRTCVGVQHHEMLCIQCDRVKGLEDFAKTQRRTPDMALCKTCSAINSNEKPLEDKNKKTGEDDKESDDESDDDDSQSNAYGSTTYDTEDMQSDSGVALPDDLTAGNLHELNISRDNTTDPSGSKASTGASVAGARPAMSQASTAGVQGWQTMSRRNGKGNVGPSRFMAYDAQGNAHVKAATSTSRSESESSDDTTTHASTTVNNQPERNFPRIRTEQFATPIPVTNGGRNVNYDSDDDDDDDDDDDSYFTI